MRSTARKYSYTVWNHQYFACILAGNLIFMHYNTQVHTVRMNTSFLKAEGVEFLFSLVWAVHRPQPHQIFVEIFKSKDSRQEILQCQWYSLKNGKTFRRRSHSLMWGNWLIQCHLGVRCFATIMATQPSTDIQDHFLLTLVPFVILLYSMW